MKSLKQIFAVGLMFAMLMTLVPFGAFGVSAAESEANLLSGKTYVISGNGLGYYGGGADDVSYRANLTDNTISEGFNWTGDEWFGFYYGENVDGLNTIDKIGTVTIDLGGTYTLNKVALHLYSGNSQDGISKPSSIKVYVSADNGVNFTPVEGTFSSTDTDNTAYWAELTLDNVTATNIAFEVTLAATFVMLDELQAFGEAASASTDTFISSESNLLSGKTPTFSGNGTGVTTEYSYNASVTDNKISEGMNWKDNEWFGFYYGSELSMLNTENGVGYAIVDLHGAYSLTKLAVHVWSGDSTSGIGNPAIKAYYSMDGGESYIPVNELFISADALETAYWMSVTLAGVKATHIRFDFIAGSSATFVMIDEIQAFGEATTIRPDEIIEGGADDIEKAGLKAAIDTASAISYKDYGEASLDKIRDAYDKAVDCLNSETATVSECNAAATELLTVIRNKAEVLSLGKSYATTPSERDDDWADDGIRLTDGSKGNFDGGSLDYAGWRESVTITIDLGSVMESDTYTVYLAAGAWGIALPMPDSFVVQVETSLDGDRYTTAGIADKIVHTGGVTAYSDVIWGTFTATVNSTSVRDARYVRFTITNEECVGHIWIDEVEVSLGEPSISGGVYVTGINEQVLNGDCMVFTPAFNNGVITGEVGGITWTTNVVAEWDTAANAYIVTDIIYAEDGKKITSITLKENQILIAGHDWESNVKPEDNPVAGSGYNASQLYNARVGDVVELSGIDIENGYCSVAPFVKFYAAGEVQEIEYYHANVIDATCTAGSYCGACQNVLSAALGHDQGEWSTLADGTQELRCTVCKELLDLIPAEPEEESSEPVEESSQPEEESSEPEEESSKPEEESSEPVVDETSEPTDDDNSDDDGSNNNNDGNSNDNSDDNSDNSDNDSKGEYKGLRGDINNNGEIDSLDYILLKRYYFGTYMLDEDAKYRADIDEKDAITSLDYILLKRAFFNTYRIQNPYVYVIIE